MNGQNKKGGTAIRPKQRMSFRKNRRTTLTLQALKQIRNAIDSGSLKPGDRVIEGEIAEKMGISRFPVREAIRLLQKEGLLVSTPFKGASVPVFIERDLQESYTLRSALEELAVRIIMENANKHTIKKLESIVASMEHAAKAQNRERLVSEDIKFHRTLCQLSGHSKLYEFWNILNSRLKCFIALEELSYENQNENVLARTHYPILEAMNSGDTQRAENSIRDHLLSALILLKATSRGRKKETEHNLEDTNRDMIL